MALDIKIDFLHDEAADKFFSSTPKAKSAVEKAAKDLGDILTNSMTQVSGDVFTGINGSTSATLDWSWSYKNPITGLQETIDSPSIAEDTVVVYVGTRSLSGSTLGQGGAGGAGVQISGSGFPSEWIGAVDAAEANSNAVMRRGSGPVIGRFSGGANFGGFIGQYDLDFGLAVGNLWFDSDTDNNGFRDSGATLESYWHYDTDTSVAASKIDLYTVALHEILHVMGAGSSQTWEDLSNGSQWLGTEAALVAGTANLLASDGSHIREDLLSPRLSDGVLQQAVLAPSITPGVRKELTELDVAILTDLGYLVTVPEPSNIVMLSLAGLICLGRRTKK